MAHEMRLSHGLHAVKALRTPVRQTHPQASDVTCTHIITSLLDEIQKHSMCDAQRDCGTLQGLPTAMLGHKPDTLRALDTYMALADVLLQLWPKVSPGTWWVGTTGQGTQKWSAHMLISVVTGGRCPGDGRLSPQNPPPPVHTHTWADTAFGHDVHFMQHVSRSAAIWHTVSGLSRLLSQ